MGRNFSSVAPPTTLSIGVNSAATNLTLASLTGYPTPQFTMVLEPGQVGEEIVTVTNVVGNVATVLRGQDGSSAVNHSPGITVRHMATGRDIQESQDHISAASGVHGLGVGSSPVGTNDAQTIDNKVFLSGDGLASALTIRAASGQTADLAVIEDSSRNPLVSVENTGKLSAGKGITVTPADSGGSAVTATGVASQVAPVVSVRNSSNTEVASIGADGATTVGALTATSVGTGSVNATTITSGTVNATTLNSPTALFSETTASSVPVTITGASSQSANLLELKNSSGTVVSSVSATGAGSFSNFPVAFKSGNDVVTTNSVGGFTITTGLGTCLGAIAGNGDVNALASATFSIHSMPGGYAIFIAKHSTSDAVIANTTFRVHWVAFGTM